MSNELRNEMNDVVKISSLPNEILLSIVCYLEYSNRVGFISCFKKWYRELMKEYVRDLEISFRSVNRPYVVEQIWKLIKNPFTQLSLSLVDEFDESIQALPVCFMDIIDTSSATFHRIECFHDQLNCLPLSVRVHYLRIHSETIIAPDFFQFLSSRFHLLCDLSVDCRTQSALIPYISTIKRLEIQNNYHSHPIPSLYKHQLQRLILSGCSITNVSNLGHIPDLQLLLLSRLTRYF